MSFALRMKRSKPSPGTVSRVWAGITSFQFGFQTLRPIRRRLVNSAGMVLKESGGFYCVAIKPCIFLHLT